jgi:hypothetical protein
VNEEPVVVDVVNPVPVPAPEPVVIDVVNTELPPPTPDSAPAADGENVVI